MANTRASLRSDYCPIWIGIGVRLFSESVSAFAGIRTRILRRQFGEKYDVKKFATSNVIFCSRILLKTFPQLAVISATQDRTLAKAKPIMKADVH